MKTLDEFVELFAEQFDDTDASEIQAGTAFHELEEWSSLIGLSVIAMVDEEFDVEVKLTSTVDTNLNTMTFSYGLPEKFTETGTAKCRELRDS